MEKGAVWRAIPVLGLVLVMVGAGFSLIAGGETASGKAPIIGQELYQKKCAVCHGTEGKGDGPAAYLLYPKPRDFVSGKFKIRSTSTLPTDEDLFKTITNGIAGTSMPSWAALPEQDRKALVAYVKGLSPVFKTQPVGEPVVIPKPPERTPPLLALGKKFYTEAGCFDCHGRSGKGDGPSAATLKDEWGYPILPYDFTIPGKMKGGSTLQEIYRTLTVGIGGTPMPSYDQALTEEERWAIAYYVRSLAAKKAPEAISETGVVTSKFVKGEIPLDPSAPAWAKAPVSRVPLRPLWTRAKTIDQVRVKSLHNGQEIAFLLEWSDPLADQSLIRSEDFRDAAAIQFPVAAAALHGEGHPEPAYTMGEKDSLVNIWHWKADWEADLARFRDIQDRYPGMAADAYLFRKGDPVGEPSSEIVKAPTTTHNPTYLTGWGAGNLLSNPSRSSSVEDLNALGFGTLTSQPSDDQNVRGKGIWQGGKWRVVFVRGMKSPSDRDAQFLPGQSLPVAFAIWDGAQGDRDGQKAVSLWQHLRVEEGR
jgi:mono/diheme cytochrome c family protein